MKTWPLYPVIYEINTWSYEILHGVYPEPKDEILHFVQDDKLAKGLG